MILIYMIYLIFEVYNYNGNENVMDYVYKLNNF